LLPTTFRLGVLMVVILIFGANRFAVAACGARRAIRDVISS